MNMIYLCVIYFVAAFVRFGTKVRTRVTVDATEVEATGAQVVAGVEINHRIRPFPNTKADTIRRRAGERPCLR